MNIDIRVLKGEDLENIRRILSTHLNVRDGLSLSSRIEDFHSNNLKYIGAEVKGKIIGITIFEKLLWDTEHFGINIGRISKIVAWEGEYRKALVVKDEMLKFIGNKCVKDEIACVYCREDINDFSSIHSLESNGFRLIDVLTTFRFDFTRNKAFQKSSNEKPSLSQGITVRAWKEEDLDKLANIAGTSYIYDRFHSDLMFPKDKSDMLHRKWVVNCCNGLTDEVLVAASDNKPFGFITCREKGAKGVIDLVGVAKDMQKKGIGAMLVNAALEWFKDRVDVVEVGTQNRNIPAMKLYTNARFMPVSSKLTFHRWFR